jgi:hypothetical protein
MIKNFHPTDGEPFGLDRPERETFRAEKETLRPERVFCPEKGNYSARERETIRPERKIIQTREGNHSDQRGTPFRPDMETIHD